MSRARSVRTTSVTSVIALHTLLELVCADPGAFSNDAHLCAALRSQGALAKHTDPERCIVPMSLNHQRSVSADALGGFSVLDDARRRAKAAVANHAAPRAQKIKRANGTKSDLTHKIAELKARNQTLLHDLLLLQRAYDLRNAQALAYAAEGGTKLLDRAKREGREIDAMFSPVPVASSSDNVVPISSERSHGNQS